jgi:large subunit ribosomal protein L4
MQATVYNVNGESTGRSIELPEDIFGIAPHEHSMWLDVKRYLNAQRQGTHKSKERWELTGSTRKLHKQKGTGGSRKGDINSPTFRGGARVFGPRPRNYDIHVNAKVKALARRSALSAKASSGDIVIVEDFGFNEPRTSAFLKVLTALKVADKKTLTVTGEYDKTLYLSSRNIQSATIAPATDINTYQILRAGSLIIAESAVAKIKATCGK